MLKSSKLKKYQNQCPSKLNGRLFKQKMNSNLSKFSQRAQLPTPTIFFTSILLMDHDMIPKFLRAVINLMKF